MEGWTVKIAGHEPGDNFGNTFRVENGVLKAAYDQYERFDHKFGTFSISNRSPAMLSAWNTGSSGTRYRRDRTGRFATAVSCSTARRQRPWTGTSRFRCPLRYGNGLIRHIVEGETVIEYSRPQLDETDEYGARLIRNGERMELEGVISQIILNRGSLHLVKADRKEGSHEPTRPT